MDARLVNPRDRDVAAIVAASAPIRSGRALMVATERMAVQSVLWRVSQQARRSWSELRPPVRASAVGTTLLAAVGVHLAVSVAAGRPAGWLWLIVPALVATTGALLVASSPARRADP